MFCVDSITKTILVTLVDIKNALSDSLHNPHHPAYCPVARAACRNLSIPLGRLEVYSDEIVIWGRNEVEPPMRVSTPQDVVKQISRFDQTGVIEPFRFFFAVQY